MSDQTDDEATTRTATGADLRGVPVGGIVPLHRLPPSERERVRVVLGTKDEEGSSDPARRSWLDIGTFERVRAGWKRIS